MLENELNQYIHLEHQLLMIGFADPTALQTAHKGIFKSSEARHNKLYQLFFQTGERMHVYVTARFATFDPL